jgi:hypothetical protein
LKGRITTVLSLAGVLVAGSAAAMVNTQVLQSTESKSNGQVTVGSTDDSNTTVPTIATGNTIDAYTKSSAALTATQAMYQVGDAGLVTLDTAGDVLTVVSVTPEPGWTLVKAENYGSASVEVKLTNGTTVVEFKANLQLGVITTSVESKSVRISTGVTTPGIGTIHDDDDDDYDDDDDDDVSVTIDFEYDDDSGHDDDD